MLVRVFIPKQPDPDDGSDHEGSDHEFPVLPEVGQTIRFTDHREGEFKVKKVQFLQDGKAFIPCVYAEAEVIPQVWIGSMIA